MLLTDTLDPIRRSSKDQLFMIQIMVAPAADNKECAKYGGACASAWVDAETFPEALNQAVFRIKQAGWDPVSLFHWELVCRDDYSAATHRADVFRSIRQCIALADEYGVGLELATWPKRGRRGRKRH